MTSRVQLATALLMAAVMALASCGGEKPAAQQPAIDDTALPSSIRETVLKPFAGDLDELVKRRIVRVGVTFNRTFYFVDRGVQRGIAYE